MRLHIVSADGAELQPLATTLDVRGSACWSPDGMWIAAGGSDGTGPGLFKVPIEGGAAVRLVAGPAFNPVWSRDGTVIVYTGPTVANKAPLRAVHPNGVPVDLPPTAIYSDGNTNGERYRFLPNGKSLVYMQGSNPWQDFWVMDLDTKKGRQLSHLTDRATMRTFDIMPDGTHVVFDRFRENSDVVLIELPRQ